jgi:ABC-type lipoprotein export system ATPase subunit
MSNTPVHMPLEKTPVAASNARHHPHGRHEEDLSARRRDHPRLRGVDVEIYTGEFITVMGPSGSGKSTFFNMIGALDSPSEGRVFIDEVDVAQLTAEELAFLRCRKIGYIFQSYNLIQYMTALENVTTPMAFGGVIRRTRRASAAWTCWTSSD